jgi:hypothetical protein
MTKKNTGGGCRRMKRLAAAFFFTALCAPAAFPEGFRNITAVNADFYFDGAYRIDVEDVFLARLVKGFSLQFKVARCDQPNYFEHVLSVGPVVNFTDTIYLDALYGLGVDSGWQFEHRAEINLTYESELTVVGAGARGSYFPASGYFFVIPSLSAQFRLCSWLAIFNKLFLSWDNVGFFSGSYWGELHWVTGEAVTIRTGGTASWSGDFGYSLLAGLNVRFSPAVLLKFYFQFLSNTVDYGAAPARAFGVQGGLILDVEF